jgi:site-specific recombinase XerD
MPTIRERIRRRNGKRETRWQVQVRLAGHGALSKTFDKFADAEAWGREQERKLKLGDTPTERRKELQAMTLKELIESYYRDREEHLHKRKLSYENEKVALDAMLGREPKLAAKTLAEFSQSDLQQYVDRRIKSGVLPSTVRRELNPLRHIYKIARRERALPVPDIFRDLSIPPDPPARERRLKQAERFQLLKATDTCRGLRQKRLWYSLILAAYCTGLRRGEILKLLWTDVDLQARTLLVRAENSKTRKSRLIPLERGLCFHLMLYRSTLSEQDKTPQSHVFSISGTAHEQAWKRLIRRAGIEDLHFHDLRHAAATHYDELGLTRSENEYMLGHNGGGTNSRYVHADIERIRAKLDAGYEDLPLPENEAQAQADWEAIRAVPDEARDVIDAWEQKGLNNLTEAEAETLAVSLVKYPTFRQYLENSCPEGERGWVGEFVDAYLRFAANKQQSARAINRE